MIRRQVAVVGIGQTPFARKSGRTAWDLALDAALEALDDAGLPAVEVDGLVRYALPTEYVTIPMMQRSLGIRELRYYAEAPLGGEATSAVVNHAVAAIASGQASVVLVWRALNQSVGVRFGRADQRLPLVSGEQDVVVPEDGENRSLTWPYGQMSPAHIFGLWARRYMYENGLSDDDLTRALGSLAIQQRLYANNNPGAVFYDRRLTWDEYEHARWISKPIRLFDMCLENDGACALLLVDAQRARDLGVEPVYVLGVTQSLASYKEPMGLYGADLMDWFPQAAVDRLYAQAGVSPTDISVAELYDATSFMPLKSLETYGLVPRGQAWKHLIEHGTGLDSPLPVNTHGGFLSEGYIHGMSTITEAVRQLRGTARNQVPDAQVALCGASFGSALILGR
ncbi:MAG TPA: lipid-transfer protein [Chloroflexota bacterium]